MWIFFLGGLGWRLGGWAVGEIKITNKLGCDIAVNSSSGTAGDHGAELRNAYCKAYFTRQKLL